MSLQRISKGWTVFGVIILVVIFLIVWLTGSYNTLVAAQVTADGGWADVEVQYQRRADLVPQLIETTKGAADFEQSTITAVTEARTNWLGAANNPDVARSEQIQAANAFDSAFSRLLVTVEAYPELTATQNFQTLQSQLEGTENRIAVARRDYNATVKVYNVLVRTFPKRLIAALFKFDEYDFFEASKGADTAPVVDFEFDK